MLSSRYGSVGGGRIQLAVPGMYTISAVWNLEAVYTGGFQVILLAFPRVGAEKK